MYIALTTTTSPRFLRKLPRIQVIRPSGQGGVARVVVRGGDPLLDGYKRLDVTATFGATSHLNVLISGDNLFEEDYAEAIGFPAPGMRARMGLRYQF